MSAVAFLDVLPVGLDGNKIALEWQPGRAPGTGLLTLKGTKGSSGRVCCYVAREFPVPAGFGVGRAVRLRKPNGIPGSDAGVEVYDVFVGRRPADRHCDCRGFLRWRNCKHAEAVAQLIGNGWLDLEPVNPDQDVRSTEPPADQPDPFA